VTASDIDLPWIDAQMTSLEELAEARAKSWLARSDRGFEVLRFREGVTVLGSTDLEKGKSFRRRPDELGISSNLDCVERFAARFHGYDLPRPSGACTIKDPG
jgi:hypothetical protein